MKEITAGELLVADCCLYYNKQYIIINKTLSIITGKSTDNNIISFKPDTRVGYIGRGTINIQFCDYLDIEEAAKELSKYLNDMHIVVLIKNNQLHVLYEKSNCLFPTCWKGHTITYILCTDKVINIK